MDGLTPTPTPAGVNETFRAYTQSTAFSLSVGRTHIRALQALELATRTDVPEARYPISDTAVAGLARRGLIVRLDSCTDRTDQPWRDKYALTTAGRLVAMLLVEAGFTDGGGLRFHPLPPPPAAVRHRVRLDLDAPDGAPSIVTTEIADGDGEWTTVAETEVRPGDPRPPLGYPARR